MGYCLPVLMRILAPEKFIQEFLLRFTWRGTFNYVKQHNWPEYKTAYETYFVQYKYYYGKSKKKKNRMLSFCLSLYDVDKALNKSHLSHLSDIILSYSECKLGEICYLFHIWKDNLLIPSKWTRNTEKCGAAWNVKWIYQDILNEYKYFKKSLKQNVNFRISMCIIERFDRIYNIMDEDIFYKFINDKSDELSNGQMEQMGYGIGSLPKWKSAYPMIKIHGTQITLTKNNTFNNSDWMDHTKEIRKKHQKMNNDSFEKNKKVKIFGLKSKPKWNGANGIITDHYNFKKERWVIKIGKPINRTVLINTRNLKTVKR